METQGFDPATVQAVVTQVTTIIGAVIASGWITNAITELLKIERFKAFGKKYPVQVAIVSSLILSGAAIWVLNLVVLTTWLTYVVFVAGTMFVATLTYDGILKKIKDGTKDPNIL